MELEKEGREVLSAEAPNVEAEKEVIPSMDDFKDEIELSFKKLRHGDMVSGPVIGVSDTEVTVDLGSYAEGIVPLDELSNDPRFSIKADIAVGDMVNCMVLSGDNGYGQVLLSIKRADNILAWDFLREAKEGNQIFKVKISEAVKGGAVTYLKGIRAFIPASGIDVNYVEDASLYLGKNISVRIVEVDEEDKKLILSAKSVIKEREAERLIEKVEGLSVGEVFVGKVERIESYGAFISLPDGLSGLCHISQLSEKRVKSPKEVVSLGEEVKVKVIAIKEGKLSLSMTAAREEEAELPLEEKIPEEYQAAEAPVTSLGDLLKNIKLS